MFTKLLPENLSGNFPKYTYAALHHGFLGMVVDSTGAQPSSSQVEAITEITRPTDVKELRDLLEKTGYLRQHVKKYSIVAVPLTDLLRSKALTSK